MKILAWNCRGFARPAAFRSLRAFCRIHKPDLIFLSETKIPPSSSQLSLSQLGFPFLIHAPPSGRKGGLVVAWKAGVEVEQINQSSSQISCLIFSDPLSQPWLLSCSYAPHNGSKLAHWNSLSSIGNSFCGPWLNIGDFNAILAPQDKLGGRSFGSSSHHDFADFVHSNGLFDLGYVGNPYTWCNRRQGLNVIKERLDRGLASRDWLHLFPNALVQHLPAAASDHNPIFVNTEGTYSTLPKPFRFESFWIRDPSSFSVIANAWDSHVWGSDALVLKQKLQATKSALKDWNVNHFGKIQSNIKSILSALDSSQKETPSPQAHAKEEALQLALQEELRREEILWKQKSRELWLTCRDLNTKFFHASTVTHRRYNSISCLKLDNGSFLYNRNDIGLHLVSHFSSIFTSSNPVLSGLDDLFNPVITSSENDLLCLIPDEYEIWMAVSDLGSDKSPGPDGMTGLFYKTYWKIVKHNVIRFIKSFFRHGHLLKSFNHTHPALIPNVTPPAR
jgi:hypothetical protein